MSFLSKLARNAAEKYIRKGEVIKIPETAPEEFLKRKAGVFVTIEKNTNQGSVLRGCIGTYLPMRKNIAEETIYNAIAAAQEDPRFDPIREEEFRELFFTVSVLSEPELIKNLSELNPKKYGIIIKTASFKTGLLLPDLEGVDTVEKQISIACQKGGINPNKEAILIYRFTIEKYS